MEDGGNAGMRFVYYCSGHGEQYELFFRRSGALTVFGGKGMAMLRVYRRSRAICCVLRRRRSCI